MAIAVVIAHIGPLWGIRLPDSVIAVQLFFMISGFYMSLILDSKYGGKSPFLFISNRFLRIFPIYWMVLIFGILGCALSAWLTGEWLFMAPYVKYYASLKPGTWLYLVFSHLLILGQEATLFFKLPIPSAVDKLPFWGFLLIPQAWSLSLELMFYIVAPFILKKRLRWVLGVMLASLALRFYIYFGLGLNRDPWTYRFFPTEILFFLMGNISYRIYAAFREDPAYLRWTRPVAAVFFGIFLGLPYLAIAEEYRAIAYFCATTAGLPFVFGLTKNLKIDRQIGELSYPVYLLHIIVSNFLMRFPFLHANPLQTLIVSVLLGMVLLKWTEPVERLRESRWRKSVPSRS